MKHIFSRDGAEVLAQFVWSRVLLAFDFDGTLAPIVAERDAASMRARTRELFAKVCALYPCAVISGRSRRDVIGRLGAAHLAQVVGNHGLEPGMSLASFEREVALARPRLEAILAGAQGVELEDKQYSFALHYRKSRRKGDAKKKILAAVRALPRRMRVIAGKSVVNVLPERAPHKGDALLRLRSQLSADTAVYVGDDVTDEDIFELDDPGRLLTIRVGRSNQSKAMYYLRDQREMDRFLSLVIKLRGQAPKS
jgi:trehalose 6-phosphate phosphatase